VTQTANFLASRLLMVKDQLRHRGIRDARVLEVFQKIPRERFLPPEDVGRAYDDEPVKIGWGQTISQPYIVALTCQALEILPSDRILEIGTGSGYETAILANLAREVISIERVPDLVPAARARLADLGLTNVTILLGDGTLGAAEHSPFQAVAVTAASPALPSPLADQLCVGGRIVIPVGNQVLQELMLFRKRVDGTLDRTKLCDCRFVSLLGRHGFPDRDV